MKQFYLLFLVVATLLLGCKSDNSSVNDNSNSREFISEPDKDLRLEYEANIAKEDSIFYGAKKEIDTSKTVQLIRENFSRISTVKEWEAVIERDLNESAEGGLARFYIFNDKLRKVDAHYYGETVQVYREFYLLDSALSFVYEKWYRYNRPLYWDSLTMVESGETEFFDFEKSKITEVRNYFSDGDVIFKQLITPEDGYLEHTIDEYGSILREDYDNILGAYNEVE